MSANTLGQIYRMCPPAYDEVLANGTLCLFLDYNGQTYRLTLEQLKELLEGKN